MDEHIERELQRAIGLSDLAMLLAAGFEFPESRLADALVNGDFLADWCVSMADACGEVSAADEALAKRCAAAFTEGEVREDTLRREYSRLFLAPGVKVHIWPYESCFQHRASGAKGAPSLFRTRIALDVERRMHEAGVAPVDEHREPGDSVFRELEFLAHLHAQQGEALRTGNESRMAVWSVRLAEFAEEHALAWMPAFMEQVSALSRLGAYRCLGDLGTRYLAELKADVQKVSTETER